MVRGDVALAAELFVFNCKWKMLCAENCEVFAAIGFNFQPEFHNGRNLRIETIVHRKVVRLPFRLRIAQKS